MPRLSVWFVRLAFASLCCGMAIGAWFLPQPGPMPPRWLDLHLELLFGGWFLHLVLGVASWILPRARTEPRMGNPWLGWSSLAFVVLGTMTALAALSMSEGLLLARGLQLAGVVCFMGYISPRVRSFGE